MRRTALVGLCSLAVSLAACNTDAPWRTRRVESPPPPATLPATPTTRAPVTAAVADDDSDLAAALDRAAWARVGWPGGEVLASRALDRLDEPVLAGSVIKIIVARAALEQGAATPETRFVCPRRVEAHGRRVDCVHPDLGRPLTLEDGLAHSCNHFFVRLAERLDRRGLAATLRRLSDGRAGPLTDAPLPLIVLGLAGPRQGMRGWLQTTLAALHDDGDAPARFAAIRRGARQAAASGTASALHDAHSLTFAKTGTTMPDGLQQEGRVVAWRPELREAVVVRAAGAAGRDAARLAAAVWRRADIAAGPVVRVGRLRSTGGLRSPRVEVLALEPYVAGVVAAEGAAGMAPAVLEALAVAARSYARAPGDRHAADGYDVCDTTHCQVLGAATHWSEAAAAATRGLALTHRGRVVGIPYSASCAGTLVAPRDLWGGTDETLTVVGAEPAAHPVAPWTHEVPMGPLLAALREAGHRGAALRGVRVLSRTRGGLPLRVAVDGLVPGELAANAFRLIVGRRLGWDVLKSDVWEVARTGAGYRFSGRGRGHGAGLCLAGASVLAGRGASTARILAAYAPRAVIWSERDHLAVRLPSALEGERAALQQQLRALLATLRLRLGVTGARDIVVYVHPTHEAYQRATGRAWWTAASTRATGGPRYRIDVAPPTGARVGAGLLTTLGHEFVHVLTAAALEDAPAWASEGLATLAPRQTLVGHAGTSGPCPSTADIRAPGDLDTMRTAYARAAVCVTVALPDGLASWRRLVN